MTYEEWVEQKKKKKQAEETTPKASSYSDWVEKTRGIELDDIAPVKTTTSKEEDSKWYDGYFQKSSVFDDGYQFGDITKAKDAFHRDVAENLLTGVVGMGEKIVDFGAWLLPAMAGGVGTQSGQGFDFDLYNEVKEDVTPFIEKDLYDEKAVSQTILQHDKWEKHTGMELDEVSVLDYKSDSLVQSAGQLGATIGLQAVGVPWWLTTGTTAFGGQAEEALKEGATFEQAGASAAIAAGAEVLTERIGGIKFGKNGLTFADEIIKPLTNKISNKVANALVNAGIDAASEGFEELVTEVCNNLGSSLYKEEDAWTLLTNEEAVNGYIDSFVGGAALGGMFGVGNLANNTVKLTESEQKVVDKVTEDRIAEKAKEGKVSEALKIKIREEVIEDMDHGRISMDTIEEVLGGDSYKTYKDTVDSEEALKKELEELNGMKTGDLTGVQSDRLAELKAMDFSDTTKRDGLKTQLRSEVYGLTKGSRLGNSYTENFKRTQSFTADLSKYDTKQQEVIKRAVESGILNDTRNTHEFVDMVAKISADKGVLFDFANNAKLKESGFAIDGKTINGFKNGDGITVNIDSAKSLNSVVGHEITHVLEGTEFYEKLQSALFDYAKTKNDYQGRYDALYKLYEGTYEADGEYDAKIKAEVTADLVGDYLFTDQNFVNNLYAKDRNVFQKVWDEIKYLWKTATAGSKEARELEKVKRAFETAYREGGKAQNSGTQYSVSDKNIKDVSTGYAYNETYFTMSYTQDGKVVATLDYGEYDGKPNVKMIEVAPEYRRKGIATKLLQELQHKYPDTEIDFGMSTPDGTKLLESITYDVTDDAVVADRQKLKDLQAELNDLQEKLDILYDTENLTEEQDAELHRLGDRWTEVYDSIRELAEELKGKKATRTYVKTDTKYSLSDSDGKQLTKEQQEYFKDSKMRDENGNLKVMYHGSQDAGFHEFNTRFSDDETSFFFVDNNTVAKSYSGTHETYEAKSFKTAEDFKDFFAEIGATEYEVVEQDGEFILLDDGDEVATSDTASGIYDEFCDWSGLGRGSANYKVYLNLTNPLEVDAKGNSWDELYLADDSSDLVIYNTLRAKLQPDGTINFWHDGKNSWETVKGNLSEVDFAKKFGQSFLNDVKEIGVDGFDAVRERLVLNKRTGEEALSTTREYSQYAKENGYDGVIFKNIVDTGLFASGMERFTPSTVAVAFDSNQIKSVANAKPTSDADIRYSMSGTNAKTANSSMLLRAEHLLDTGVDSETVRKETGWYKGYDGRMRFEIDDSKSELIENPNLEKHENDGTTYFTGKLSDILNHDDLYEAYPQLRNVNIIIQETEPGTRGIYQPNSNYLTLSLELFKRHTKEYEGYLNGDRQAEIERIEQTPEYKEYNKWYEDEELTEKLDPETWLEGEKEASDKFFNSELGKRYHQLKWGKVNIQKFEFGWGKEAREVLMHEIQHAIQKIENFSSGSSPGYWRRVLASGDTIQTAEQKAELREAENKLYAIYKQNPEFYAEMTNLLYSTPKMPRGKIDWETLEQIEDDPIEWQEFDKKRDALEDKYGDSEVFDFMDMYYNVERYRARSLDADDAYYNTAGEIEARDTANRLNLTAEERRNKRPDIDNKRVVFTDRYSLSDSTETPTEYGKWNIYGKDVRYTPEVAPVSKTETTVAKNAPVAPVMEDEPIGDREMFPDDPMLPVEDSEDRMLSLDDDDVPVWESDSAPEPTESSKPDDPFEERDWKAVGNRKTKAYMYENPEVKPFFQEAAEAMLGDLQNSVKGERWYNDELYYESGGEYGYSGTERQTTDDIAYLLDEGHYTYAEIEKGLKAIIEDNGAENNACSKRIEFLLNDRLRDGYTDVNGYDIPANQDYLNLLTAKNVTEYSEESWNNLMAQAENTAPVQTAPVENEHPVKEAEKQEAEKPERKTAKIVYDEMPQRKKLSAWKWAKEHILSHGAVFEDLSLETGNRELQARFDSIRRAESMAQHFIGNGKNNVSALKDVRSAVESSGKTESFNDYMYHLHNIDRMSLETEENRVLREGLKAKLEGYSDKQIEALAMEWIRKDTPEDHVQKIKDARAYVDSLKEKNKPVFGDDVTAEVSKGIVAELEAENPEFKEYAEEIYGINRYLREMLVENGVISRETSELWEKIYPHYVPIHRVNKNGQNVNVPLDTNRTGVNAPIKRAKGGNDDFYDLFRTMAERVEQTYKAVTKNRFGVELKNTLGTTIESESVSGLEEVFDSLDQHEELLQKGENGENPTFTVFENGKRVKFEITDEMYEAMKPNQFNGTIAPLNKINNLRRNVLTTWSPTFALTNPIKDVQDILMNSQHPAQTYKALPKAIKEVMTKGQWYQERMEHGGDQDTYFDGQVKEFVGDKTGIQKFLGKLQYANEVIEQVPRMAEYIASREMGRSIDVSMLDAARVTTNFGASGDFTNMLNRNGATFLSASVEGFNQQVRNIREAKAQGLKGWGVLAAKTIVAGLPAMLLNHLLWDDDEEYEELSDYVKQNYYIVGKFGDGKFVRIPKGRTVAVIQDALKQMENLVTGNDEVDLMAFADLVKTNLAPNNVFDNNIIAPITQAIGNNAWYGGDLVPTRLQDLPKAEQFDETTDSISKWLGEVTNTSPYKWNYVIDQYTGGAGDILLPYLTPSADGGGLGAAMRDKFTTDSTLKNQSVTDFYDTNDKLAVNANSMYASDEDVLMSKYMNTINSKMGELYGQKREVQNSNLSDKEKNAQVRELQSQINALAREGLNTYGSVKIDNGYATVGDVHYRKNKGEWTKITDDQLDKQIAVTSDLGISPSEYWSDKNEYDFMYEYPEKHEFFSNNGISYDDYADADEDGKRAYNWAYENPGKYTMSKAFSDDFLTYYGYRDELNDIEADKDEDGKSISGSKKEKVISYINDMNLDYGQKIILFRSMYSSKEDRANYNADIVEYLNGRDDISYEDMVTILEELDMKVSSDGSVTWD